MVESQPLWTPTPKRIRQAALTHFRSTVEAHTGRALANYRPLHIWSVADPVSFWAFYTEYAGFNEFRPHIFGWGTW